MYIPKIHNSWIKNSIQNSFSGMYLTLLSIIQGIALSLLVGKVFDTQLGYPILSICGIEYLVMCLLTLLIIIVVWHSYFWLAAIAAWTPLIWDSVLMFLMGAIEFIVVNSIGSTYWFFAVAIIGILSGLQYFYNVKKLPEEAWDEDTKDKEGDMGEDGVRRNDIGGWIRKYKMKRGWRLLIIGLGILLVTWVSHLSSWFNFLIFGYSALKGILFFGIISGLCYAFKQHIKDQKQTLEKLDPKSK